MGRQERRESDMNDDTGEGEAESVILARLTLAQQDHADLDVAIQAIAAAPVPNMMVISRLKRKKLLLKDEIERLKDQLTPDIIA